MIKFPLRPLVLSLSLLLSGCAAPLPPAPTTLALHLQASADLNLNLVGVPTSVVVRLIELKAPGEFERADFFALYDRADTTLAGDFAGQQERTLRSGRSLQVALTPTPETRYLGVLGAFRDLPHTRWRYLIALHPATPNSVYLRFGADGIHPIPSSTNPLEAQP